jgi:hypothetical protein
MADINTTLSQILMVRGLPGGLAFLNEMVPHRFTAVYRFAGVIVKNVCLHDALGKRRPHFLSAMPRDKSLAQFVSPGTPFRTDNSRDDPRLDGHAYEHLLFSYHGTALCDRTGALWGVLCHFDLTAMTLTDEAFELLGAVAPVVADFAIDPHGWQSSFGRGKVWSKLSRAE